MKIIVDAFGGDNAPHEIIKGCVEAAAEYGIDIVLAGDAGKIKAAAKELALTEQVGEMEILHCADTIDMEADPSDILRAKKESSMAVGLRALAAGKGDAFASAGNSGALVVGATMIVKRLKGVKRVSFAPVMPSSKGFFMLSDGGANVDARPAMLLQFATMASSYMQHVMGIESPRVALVNVGEEAHKGDALRTETYKLMQKSNEIRFIGNIEARDIPYGAADVVITDGFTGNIILKLYEGVAGAVMDMMKDVFKKNLKNKLAASVVYGDMKVLKKAMDYNEYGGAPIMGAAKPVFKIHGSAKASTVKSALRLTKAYAESGITQKMADTLSKQKEKMGNEHETG